MIRTENEYKEAVQLAEEQRQRLAEQESKLKELSLSRAEIKRAMDPVRSFHEQLREEIASYERLSRGEFEELHNLDGLGELLIGLRIAAGVTQRDLAARLRAHESQISRDEKNEYHGVSIERANRILEALGATLRTTVVPVRPRAARHGALVP